MTKHFILLVKTQIINAFVPRRQRNSERLKGFAVLLPFLAMVYCAVVFSFQFFDSFTPENYKIIPYIMIVMGVMFTLLMTIGSAKGLLFGFKDFDFLMSLPLSRIDIMLSKLVSFLVLEYAYSGFYIIPSLIIYGTKTGQGFLFYLYSLIGFLFIPLIPIVIASLIAMFIKRFTARSRFQSGFEALFFFLIFAVAFGFSFFSMSFDSITDTSVIIDTIKIYLPFAYFYANGVVNLNIVDILISIAISLGVFVIFVFIFNKIFIGINNLGNEGYHVKNYHLNKINKDSVDTVLFKKELKRLFANIPYLMNTGMGLILALIGSIIAVFNRSVILDFFTQMELPQNSIPIILVLITLLLGLMSSMSCTTGVSISLEGKNLWITKSLPITANQVFISKAKVNIYLILVITIPSILLLGISFGGDIGILLMCVLYFVAIALFTAMFGLVVNLFFPKLDFDRDIIVIKQSASSFVSIFSNLILSTAILFGAGYLVSQNMPIISILLIIISFYALMDIILFMYLKKKGTQKFNKLQA